MRMQRAAFCASIASLFLALWLSGCTVERRYRVLSFFFDGVLVPPELVDVTPSQEAPSEGIEVLTAETSPTLLLMGEPAGRRILGGARGESHFDMPSDKCRICHQEERGLEARAEVSREFCDQCHEERRLAENWNHGPINLGHCKPCHVAGHQSPYPHLMEMPMPDACLYCHVEQARSGRTFHSMDNLKIDENNCVACHDPHRVF